MGQVHSTKRHMWFIMRLISKLFILTFIAACTTTGSFDPNKIEVENPGPKSQVFNASFADVWKAALVTIGKYPLKSYDEDAGVIETSYIRGEDVWLPPYKDRYVTGGYRYRITIRLMKVKSNKHEAIQVVALKEPEIQKDFFTNSQKVQSDGLEELSILYRIGRVLSIDQKLKTIKTSK